MFFTSFGHDGSTWENETFHKHLIEGFKWSLKLTDGPSEPNPDLQAQVSFKAFTVFASQKMNLDHDKILKTMMAKSADAKFIKLLRENSWKSKGRNIDIIKAVLAEVKQ